MKEKWLKAFLFAAVLYLFFISIESMGGAFKLFGREFAERLLETTTNPFVGLFIGILATSLIQSSSTTTSIVVGMVAVGTIPLNCAIPIIMGANVGTSVTNMLVAFGHITRRSEFRLAFSGATVHDFFNLLAVAVFLPLELMTGYLYKASSLLTKVFADIGGLKFVSPLKTIVAPVVHLLREAVLYLSGGRPKIAGIIMLCVALALLFLSIRSLVKIMKGLVIGKIESLMHDYLFQTTLRAFVLGILFTAVIQSSSITTSLIVPLVGAGILTLEAIYPYTLGANIGTTITAILASMVTGEPAAVAVAFSHLLFNLSGCAMFLPLRRKPIVMARKLGEIAENRRYVAVLFVVVVFYIIPIICIILTN